ncbi:Ltp family lipoprotein [Microbacterium sp. EST19A]|uniref:Ltp family lipoprotein n=1 Tax=Microbacterium sp. EST19A TaxID=2862681 RepID=UPI001CC07015|nr:Ltp family lipoprotein [Microbacterium sp. EST19A]
MSNQNPAPGWYPAPHANNEQRYWDGTQWIEPHVAARTESATPAYLSTAITQTAAPINDHPTPAPINDHPTPAPINDHPTPAVPAELKNKKRGWMIAGSVAAGLLVIGGLGSALGLGTHGHDAATAPHHSVAADAPNVEEEAELAVVGVPAVVGLPVSEAIAAITAAGLNAPAVSSFEDPAALVVSSDPVAGVEAHEGDDIALVVAEKLKLTLGQQNAVGSAKSYIGFSDFSRTGLIDQLEYEGFSTEDATFGADNSGADWNQEAAESAQSYLEYSAFSRQGLYDQLAYEGFQPSEIEFGLAAVGY